MKLPYEQDILIKELLNANPKTVIVLTGGSPVEMGEWIDSADTVVWNWYAGLEGGRAIRPESSRRHSIGGTQTALPMFWVNSPAGIK